MGSGGSKSGSASWLEAHKDHEGAINFMALSQDGSLLLTGSEDSTARMWSSAAEPMDCLEVLRGHTSYVSAVALLDGFAVTASADATVRKWDLATCECVFVYQGHADRIHKLILTGELVISSSSDATARAWLFDTETANEDDISVQTFRGHDKAVIPIIYIPGASEEGLEDVTADVLITGSLDGSARSWVVATGETKRAFRRAGGPSPVTTLAADDDGATLFAGYADGGIVVWNIETGQQKRVLSGHTAGITCLHVVNRLMYSGSQDTTAKCWVTEFGDRTAEFRGHGHSVTCIRFAHGILYTGCGDSLLRAFDVKKGTLLRTYEGSEACVSALEVSGSKVFTGDGAGHLRVWPAAEA